MKKFYPDSEERIRHILANQVYGMAPTRIIYLIATNYIMGFDERFKENNPHFVQEDAAEAAKNGCLAERVGCALWRIEDNKRPCPNGQSFFACQKDAA